MPEKISKRSKTREKLMQMLFQMEVLGDFTEKTKASFKDEHLEEGSDEAYFDAAFAAYINHNNDIDDIIEQYSRGWKIERLAKVDLSVLRLCLAEILYLSDAEIPASASISEAVRIAKAYGSDDSGKFVNGILGRIYREKCAPAQEK